MIAHCLFEQSGTFKNQFKALGIDAYDYDIQNEFGETDYVSDIFKEIRGGYEGKASIFDEFKNDDIVMAFFPCVRFEAQIRMHFNGTVYQFQKLDQIQKLEEDLRLEEERAEMYELISKLAIIALKKGFPMIIENPYSQDHYLKMFWSLPCTIIDRDRTKNGDYYVKPTQYWFLNCEPKNNTLLMPMQETERKTIKTTSNKTDRSMITKQYANRFIRQFIIEDREDNRPLDKDCIVSFADAKWATKIN